MTLLEFVRLERERPVSYMVIYNVDGEPSYHEVDELDAAVTFVENLRNSNGIERARLVSLQDVGFEFRPYYRVQIGDKAAGGAPATAVQGSAATSPARPTDRDEYASPRPEASSRESREGRESRDGRESRENRETNTEVWDTGVATDPALPPELVASEEVGANVRRGLFGR
jgi:hypothetical protein